MLPLPEVVRVLLVSRDHTSALMLNEGGQWDFPNFFFRREDFDNLLRLSDDLSNTFGVDPSRHCFTPVVELIGFYTAITMGRCNVMGLPSVDYPLSHLVWMEWHMDNLQLPEGYEWKDASFIASLTADQRDDNTFEVAINRAVQFLEKEAGRTNEIWQPRHQIGWFKKASTWFREVVEGNGGFLSNPVTHFRVSNLSTILKAEATNGAFFLKAPNAGPGEVQLTEAIHMMMPERTLDVVAFNKQLQCFVSKEFLPVELPYGSDTVLHSSILQALGETHLASLEYKHRLIESGMPHLSIPQLIDQVEKLLNNEDNHKGIEEFVLELTSIIPNVVARLRRLEQYKIPLVMIHGDFSDENCAIVQDSDGSERLVFHDWMFATISHPFFDFSNFEISEEKRDEYLRIWTEYESLERCREAFELAKPMGWLVKLFPFLSCSNASDPQFCSESFHYGFIEHWRCTADRIAAAEKSATNGMG